VGECVLGTDEDAQANEAEPSNARSSPPPKKTNEKGRRKSNYLDDKFHPV
jgi:hypothetical protein